MIFQRPYIKTEWQNSIINYKYKGEDNSIFHNYVANPLCDILVNFFPKWVAPNVITLMGLMCNISLNVITLYYGGIKAGGDCPSWVGFIGSFLYFTYFLFDIIDGKQARRTNSSSPLGLMFDHNCDSLTTFVFTLALAAIIKTDTIIYYSFMWFMACGAFFFTTLEEYFTDIMYFPMIHGVSEGTLCACAGMIVVGIKGSNYYIDTEFDLFFIKISLCHIIIILLLLTSNCFSIMSIVKIYKKYKGRLIEASIYACSFLFIICSLLIVQICYRGNEKAYYTNSKLIIFAYGFLFSKLVGYLQIAHLAKVRFNPYRIEIMASCVILPAAALIECFFQFSVIEIDYLVIFFLFFNFSSWLHFAYYMSKEMCEFLNIKRFSIAPIKEK